MTVGGENYLRCYTKHAPNADCQTQSRASPSRCLDLSISSPSRPRTGPLWISLWTSPTDSPGSGGGLLGALTVERPPSQANQSEPRQATSFPLRLSKREGAIAIRGSVVGRTEGPTFLARASTKTRWERMVDGSDFANGSLLGSCGTCRMPKGRRLGGGGWDGTDFLLLRRLTGTGQV